MRPDLPAGHTATNNIYISIKKKEKKKKMHQKRAADLVNTESNLKYRGFFET